MKNGKYCIAVMSIGSGIGQSVINSCNLSMLPLHTIGFDINPFAFGAYECDEFVEIPPINSGKYLPFLIDRCIYDNIDLIIPGLEDELMILAEASKILNKNGTQVLSSSKELISIVRNKERIFKEFSQITDIFVKSYSLLQVKNLLVSKSIRFPLIAKPLNGSSSEGIIVLLCEEDLKNIDNNYLIQEIAIPKEGDPNRDLYLKKICQGKNIQVSEISIQLVADTGGEIIGRMMSYNRLKNGVPIEIFPFHDPSIFNKIDLLLPKLKELGYRGPLNIQGRLTNDGFKIFEMNARFTGITGLRALIGFNEVAICIEKWLKIENTKNLEVNYNKFGIRQVLDKVVSKDGAKRTLNLKNNINLAKNNYKKTVLVTGANGFLGQALINRLNLEKYKILAMGRSLEILEQIFKSLKNISYITINDFYKGNLQLGNIDFLIHCAFARPNRSYEEIADSLRFTNLLFFSAMENQVPAIINISSQSVYGTNHINDWAENDKPMPETSYAQAKYASELLLENIVINNKHTSGTSLRLATLSGASNGLLQNELLTKVIAKIIRGEDIKINGGKQKIERLDIRDAANGIVEFTKTDNRKWKRLYNLCTGNTYTLDEVMEKIDSIGKKYNYNSKFINIESNDAKSSGMDNALFKSQVKWEYQYKLEDTIKSIFDYLLNLNK